MHYESMFIGLVGGITVALAVVKILLRQRLNPVVVGMTLFCQIIDDLENILQGPCEGIHLPVATNSLAYYLLNDYVNAIISGYDVKSPIVNAAIKEFKNRLSQEELDNLLNDIQRVLSQVVEKLKGRDLERFNHAQAIFAEAMRSKSNN